VAKKSNREIEDAIENIANDLDIDDEDYCFIVGPDGELKMVFMPDDDIVDKVPATVKKIFKIFKIQDPDQLDSGGMLH
jgi:hypothetical protein